MTKQQLNILRDRITFVLQDYLNNEEAIERANNITQLFSFPVDESEESEILEDIVCFLNRSTVKTGIAVEQRQKVAHTIYQQYKNR